MSESNRSKTATIPAIERAPARDAHVSIEYQWAVNLGIEMADCGVSLLGDMPLHFFLPMSAAQFEADLLAGAGRVGMTLPQAEVAASSQAFLAGLLGRVQQYMHVGFSGQMTTRSTAAISPYRH